MPRRRWMWAGIFWAWWTVSALLFANMYHFGSQVRGRPMPWSEALIIGFFDMYLWGAVSLVALFAAWHLPLERGRWTWVVPLHLLIGAVLILGRMSMDHWVLPLFLDGSAQLSFAQRVVMQGTGHAVVYPLWVGIGYAIRYFQRYRDRELTASRLETQLSRAELRVLKMQLNPHFLFNTLNAVSALMHRDVEMADRMLARLGDLLRLALDTVGTQEVALRAELEFLESYLQIERMRLGERLTVHFDIDPATYDATVPHLILQPLVENAIRHAIAPYAKPGHIEVSARRVRDMLYLQVSDNGPGLQAESPSSGSRVGLANTRARLAGLYGEQHTFLLRDNPRGGLVASIAVPLRPIPQLTSTPEMEVEGEDPDAHRRRRATGARASPQVARRGA